MLYLPGLLLIVLVAIGIYSNGIYSKNRLLLLLSILWILLLIAYNEKIIYITNPLIFSLLIAISIGGFFYIILKMTIKSDSSINKPIDSKTENSKIDNTTNMNGQIESIEIENRIVHIRKHISESNYENAIDLMMLYSKEIAEENTYNELLLIKSKYNKLKYEIRIGIISSEEKNIEYSRIAHALVEIQKNIENINN